MTAQSPATDGPIILNGFSMDAVSHVNYGLWRHPRDQTHRYNTIAYWLELARILDEGRFDTFFLADAVGLLDTYGGSAATSLRTGTQSPLSDPLLLVSALAAGTTHLGFGVTVSTTYEHPYLLARKFTTLDHLTGGRVAWNIVTSQLDSAARNLGLDTQIPHDERYERADEFLDVAYKLWEGSWEDDAVVRDRDRNVYTDPGKVHGIAHRGRHFSVPRRPPVRAELRNAPRCSYKPAARRVASTSPPNTPKWCSWPGPTPPESGATSETIRGLAAHYGRDPDS